jgi:Fe-S cluster biosynthesis and repair protein YggX
MNTPKTIHCHKFQTELESLPRQPFPGERGSWIFENISKKAWSEWLTLQTRLINEKQLNVMLPEHKVYLQKQQEAFFNNEKTDDAEGFKPKT